MGEVGSDGSIQLGSLGLLLAKLRRQPRHLLLERPAVVFLRLRADISPGGENMTVLADLLKRRALAESGRATDGQRAGAQRAPR